jgi:signal transduction histidine kinase
VTGSAPRLAGTWRMPWKAIATVIFTVALSLPFLGIWAIASSAGRVQRQARWQVHTVLVQTGIGEVERQVLGLEGAVRGFMLSGDDRYLGRLPTAQADLDLDLANLSRLTADNPGQLNRLDTLRPLVRTRIGNFNQLVAIRRRSGLEAGALEMGKGIGTGLTVSIQGVLNAMKAEEDRLVIQSSRATEEEFWLFRRVLFLGLAAVGLLSALALLFLKWGLDERACARRIVDRERRVAEEAIQATTAKLRQSNRDLAQFASVASHDLKEPLRMVASFTELLARKYRGRLDADADEYIGFAVDGAKRMQVLIDDLLQYSRITSQGRPPERSAAGEALALGILNLQGAIRESAAVITQDPLPLVDADASQLAMLFQNLLGNAIKFRGPAPPRIHIAAAREDRVWHFTVTDDGIGIDPKHHQRIFEIFQRLHTRAEYPGTGIGLALCKRIVERHGGRIWVGSQPGQGATFHFTLPCAGDQL